MKVIDLLNKIANGEEVPKKIHYNCVPLYWCEPCKIYEAMTDGELCGKDLYILLDNLNDEVEILEEEPRDMEVCGSLFTKSEYDKLAHSEEEKKIPRRLGINDITLIDLFAKINEIIDYLKSKGE